MILSWACCTVVCCTAAAGAYGLESIHGLTGREGRVGDSEGALMHADELFVAP